MRTNNIEIQQETIDTILSMAYHYFYMPWEIVQFIFFIIILSIITTIFTKRNIANTYPQKIKQQKAKRLYNRRINRKNSWVLLLYLINTIVFTIGALSMTNEYSRPLGIGIITPVYISYSPIKIFAQYQIIGSLALIILAIFLSTASYNDKKMCYRINIFTRQTITMTLIALITGYSIKYFINIEHIVLSMTIGIAIFSIIENEFILFFLDQRYKEQKQKTPNGLAKKHLSQLKY